MKLTAKQEKFTQGLASGLNNSDAYRQAYGAEGMTPATIHKRASELSKNRKVTGRVQELKKELADKELWTREKSTRFWLEVITDDTGEFKSNDKVNAGKQLDKTHGFEQVNIDHTTNGKELTAPAFGSLYGIKEEEDAES